MRQTAASIVSPASSTETVTGSRDETRGLGVDRLVLLRLAALLVEALPEVAAAVEQADADERHAELGGGLQVVAGEDAEPAGVDRQRLVDAELHAEVGDEHAVAARVGALPPADGVRDRVRHGAEVTA